MIQNENKDSHQTAVAIGILESQYLYQKANWLVGISAVWGGIPLLQTWMHQLRNGRWSGEPISKVIYFLINTQPYKATSMFFLLCVRMKNCSYFSTHVKKYFTTFSLQLSQKYSNFFLPSSHAVYSNQGKQITPLKTGLSDLLKALRTAFLLIHSP